jgi:hypothetical protein
MLDLLFVSDAVRQKTMESLATDVRAKPRPKRDRRRRAAVRSGSAAALRGLADLIDPSRADVIAN